MDNTKLSNSETEELLTKFSKKMIHILIKYKPPKLFTGCYVELDLVQGKFFGEKTIGQLVGKSGERKEEFFALTGIKPHIEDSKEKPLLILSKYNVREIKLASLLGKRFRSSKSWSSSSIHKHFQQLSKQLSEEEDTVGFRELESFDVELASTSLKNAVGKMSNENYSDSQTLLEHAKEVASESVKAATMLAFDTKKVRKLAFYHDIGKVFLPYYLHDSNKVFEFMPELADAEIKECIETHHSSLLSFENPNIALISLVNKLISQSHFLKNYPISENIHNLLGNIKTQLDELLSQEKLLKSYSYLSAQTIWLILNLSSSSLLVEEEWTSFISSIKECVSKQLSISETLKDTEEESKLTISIYCLPGENLKPSITKLRFNLNQIKPSI
ncbi:HDIG domain-containing metalloprotein [Candidatus Mycoplasma haematominutum]|uniref:Phosphohydrolase n=1 Tax=Candidatus Mycoplasma haematominutum 'Birmingham 1' TaxID=1116213 RepID=G8C2M7_9MOLU|nr:HDIG domain-containing metalloprotein [Candidatus Mycoplasma haematominutum]CCE66575.1 phosphohydrolase [Candidatus Mycoplasma haematominutum 'Birmingham 1']